MLLLYVLLNFLGLVMLGWAAQAHGRTLWLVLLVFGWTIRQVNILIEAAVFRQHDAHGDDGELPDGSCQQQGDGHEGQRHQRESLEPRHRGDLSRRGERYRVDAEGQRRHAGQRRARMAGAACPPLDAGGQQRAERRERQERAAAQPHGPLDAVREDLARSRLRRSARAGTARRRSRSTTRRAERGRASLRSAAPRSLAQFRRPPDRTRWQRDRPQIAVSAGPRVRTAIVLPTLPNHESP